MKRIVLFLICMILAVTPVISVSEESELTENEKQFLGSWVMYMANGRTTYLFTITFFDDHQVVMKTISFEGSTLVSDHTASGKWAGFTSETILLSLAGNQFVGGIKEDGLFALLDYQTKEASGFFSRCPDLSDRMV